MTCEDQKDISTRISANNVNIAAGIYLFKVNNENTRIRCEICSELTVKTPERRQANSDWVISYLLPYFHEKKNEMGIYL